MSNNYSDHSVLFFRELKKDGFGVCNLNVAQPGKLTTYGTKEKPVCSSSLRTVKLLSILYDKKDDIDELLCSKTSEIMMDNKLSVQEKNEKIKEIAESAYKSIVLFGFEDIEPPVCWPSRCYNWGANPEDIKRNPQNYLHAPVFVLENDNVFKERMSRAYNCALDCNADVFTFQEVELGNPFYDKILCDSLSNFGYHEYDVAEYPKVSGVTSSCVVTVPGVGVKIIKDEKSVLLLSMFKNMFNLRDPSKICVTAIEKNGLVKYIVNIHAGYGEANKSEDIYSFLCKVLNAIPNLVVAGDFNLQIAKESWITKAFSRWNGVYNILTTPEVVLGNKANPTYDMVFIGNGEEKDVVLEELLNELLKESEELKLKLYN